MAGYQIGVLPTIALGGIDCGNWRILTDVAKVLQTYSRFNQALSEGRMPANEILEGVALLIGGCFIAHARVFY